MINDIMIVHYFQVIIFKQTEHWKRILQDNEQIQNTEPLEQTFVMVIKQNTRGSVSCDLRGFCVQQETKNANQHILAYFIFTFKSKTFSVNQNLEHLFQL